MTAVVVGAVAPTATAEPKALHAPTAPLVAPASPVRASATISPSYALLTTPTAVSPSPATAAPAAPSAPVTVTHPAGGAGVPSQTTVSTSWAATVAASENGPGEPPAPSVASSGLFVVELADRSATIRALGDGSTWTMPLSALFGSGVSVDGAGPLDAAVVFDPSSTRWFISVDVNDPVTVSGQVQIATSAGSDPTGAWSVQTVASATGSYPDGLEMGLDSDKVVLAWEDFDSSGAFATEEAWVLQKSDLVSGVAAEAARLFGTDTARRHLVPAVSSTASTTAYLAYNNSDCAGLGCNPASSNSLGLITVTGDPAGRDVGVSESFLPITPTSVPPLAVQPGCPSGSSCDLETGDDRIRSAVAGSGVVWLAAGDSCRPTGDTTTRNCVRLVGVAPGATPAVRVDVDLGAAGSDWFSPGLALDAEGDVAVSLGRSSASTYPSAAVVVVPAAAGTAVAASASVVTYRAGLAAYGGALWGAGSGASADPDDSQGFWVAGEYSSGSCCGGLNWSTAAAQVHVQSAPGSPSAVTASVGGTSVTVSWGAPALWGGGSDTGYGVTLSGTPLRAPVTPTYLTGAEPVSYRLSGLADGTYWVGVEASDSFGWSLPSQVEVTIGPPTTPSGYRVLDRNGAVYSFGLPTYGSMAGHPLTQPVVGGAPTPDGRGYWLVAADGGVFSFGDAVFHGSAGNLHLVRPIVGMTAAPGGGYWFVASDGGVFDYGAGFYGSAGNLPLVKPIVGMTATPDGRGYWLVASDGGIFAYGDAHFYGSTGNIALNAPVVGMTASPDGRGYWLVASDGGIFAFGDARFYGSTGNIRLARPIVSMSSTPDGRGYRMVASDGGVFSFGDARFLGSVPGLGVATTGATGLISSPLG